MHSLVTTLIVCLLLVLSSCAGLPTESQTGRTAVVRISNAQVTPRDIPVQPGDAVQLLNVRDKPVWIYLGRDRPKELSCQRGFSFFWGVEEVAKVAPGASASVCFSAPGEYCYWVQSQPTVQGGARLGELDMPASLPGAIIVEGIRGSPLGR